MAEITTLVMLDYVILAVILIASLGIGFYFACIGDKQKTTKEYFKANSNMKLLPVVMSMIAGYVSSNVMLGVPAEVYHYGFNYWYYNVLGAFLGGPIAIYGFMPVFYKLQITSICEYTHNRFNKSVRVCSSVLYIFTMTVIASFTTYAPSLALSQVTGLSVWTSVVTTTLIGSIYTSIGGIKAVIWTDVLQLVVLAVALFATIIKGCMVVGGVSYIFKQSIKGERFSTLSFSLDPRVRYTFWGVLISSTARYMFMYGVSQTQLQRYMCCSNKKAVRRSIWMNLLSFIPIASIYCFVGLMLYAMYWNCDPFLSQQIEKQDQLFPLFVMHSMASIPGMPGLFVAGVYSAALSSLSSLLNSLAALTLEDLVKLKWKNITDTKATLISKFLSMGYGIFCLLMVAAIMNLGSIVQAMQYLMGGTTGAILGLFVLGLMNPWANAKGSLLGIICGLCMSWWISLGTQLYRPPPNSLLPISVANCSDILGEWSPRPKLFRNTENILAIYEISYLWIIPIAFITTVVVGSITSLCIGSNERYDMKLLSPFVHSFMKKLFNNKYKDLQKKNNPVFQIENSSKNLNSTEKQECTI